VKRILPAALLLGALLVVSGCASMRTAKSHLEDVDKKLNMHDYTGAVAMVESVKEKNYSAKDRVLYYLDVGMLQHYAEQYDASSASLSSAESSIEELFTKSVSKAALSLMLNDNALDYDGEDYEDIYLNVFKALNYMHLGHRDEAMVEVRRIQNKLNVLNDKYNGLAKGYNQSDDAKIDIKPGTSRFHDSALAQWLGMLLYRADGKLDDARISRDDLAGAFREQPQLYPFAQPVLDGYLAPSDQPRLDVVAFVGRGPDKKANTLYIHTEDDLIVIGATEENPHNRQELTELDAFVWPGVKKGYHFKFQLPYMEKRGTGVSRVRLLVDGASVGDLSPIESLEDVAEDTWQIKQPIIYLKTIIRATAKGLLAEQGKRKMEDQLNNELLGFVARLAADAAVDATENADLRIARFFPARALVGEFTVPAGTHRLSAEYFGPGGVLLFTDDLGEVDIRPGGLNLQETFYLK